MAADPEVAFFARASGDAALVALLSAGGIGSDFPDTLGRADYPRLSYVLVSGVPVRKLWEDGRFQVDVWVWPHEPGDASTGKARTRAIDERLRALFHEVGWTDAEGVRWYAQSGPWRDWPTAPTGAMRRMRTITVKRLTGQA